VAAIGSADRILSTTSSRLTEYLDANVVGPHRVVVAFLDALKKGEKKIIVLISSQSGSLTRQVNATRGFMGPYVSRIFKYRLHVQQADMATTHLQQAVTKAAVNMLAVQLHNELNSDGFKVIPLHPGRSAFLMPGVSRSIIT
jgi:NAD(P)-dependent dehydrogenase (short-subunit alcohol dehydrogenase family)